jgi:hypothetical protein
MHSSKVVDLDHINPTERAAMLLSIAYTDFKNKIRMLNVYGAQEELSYKDSGLTEILVSKLNSSYLGKVKLQRPRKLEELKEVLQAIDDEHKREKSDISNRKEQGDEINSKMKSKNKLSRRLCYKCRKRGHVARNCKLERKKND